MNTPTFTGAFIIGDVTYRVTDAIINSISVNTFPYPICITSCESPYEQYMQPPYKQTEITLKISGSKIILDTNGNKKVSNKLVKDCSVEELLFAIQKKLDK